MQVPNQGELIFNRDARQRDSAAQGRSAALAPQSESPDLARLRQQASPPPATGPAQRAGAPPSQPPTVASQPAASGAATAGAPAGTARAPQTAPVESASTVAQPRTAVPRPAGRSVVQLGALSSDTAARAEWDRLTRLLPSDFQGRQPTISAFPREGQPTLYRLRATGLADAEAARAFCDRVKARGGACSIVGG
ncbi:SPOR domain-containing protein [Humitalea sp. 24SJ18S-53]|uniref:SPOR domain-containing protein n=1 Tax=Humitalea sp. 24SJ18S-53 TaxID=3422307 RepID=UPI003D6788EC